MVINLDDSKFKSLSIDRKVKVYILAKNIIKLHEATDNYLKSLNVVNNLRASFNFTDLSLVEDLVEDIESKKDLDLSNFVLNVLFKESE